MAMRTRLSALTFIVVVVVAVPAAAQSFTAVAILNGGEIVPAPVLTGAIGAAALEIDLDAGTATFDVAIFNVAGAITGAHLHLGTSRTVGPVLFDLRPVPNQTGDFVLHGTIDSASITPQFDMGIRDTLDALQCVLGMTVYIDIHTNSKPDGEIRGTLVPASAEDQTAAAVYHTMRRSIAARR